ncbi:MAG: hypothetical protein M3447_00925 [Acidobacteriota bacterium]|nr:hypothetical protein [Acidobacteriota bacterium]
MSFSRRKFLRAGTMVAIATGIPLKTIVGETLSQPDSRIPGNDHLKAVLYLDRETFARHLNTKFAFSLGTAEKVAVKLIEVKDLTPEAARPSAAATGRECFAAVFVGSATHPLRQETYTVTHSKLGRFSMLVVPVGRDTEGFYYEAVFNRLH